MAKVNYFLLCENFILDIGKRGTIVNIFDQVLASELPATALRFMFALSINMEEKDIEGASPSLRIEIIHVESEGLVAKIQSSSLEMTSQGNLLAPLDLSGGITFNSWGDHVANLYVNDKIAAEYKFGVVKQ
jgi:hypothetical protein